MAWFIVVLSYLIGSIPTAYLAGKFTRGKDIRDMGDGNMGAQNVFRQISPLPGIIVGLFDAGKGFLVIILARAAGSNQGWVFAAGIVAVLGHNWPIFLGFRGGRGEAATIGILYALIPVPVLILTIPGILILSLTRNVTLSSAIIFIVMPFICWWQRVEGVIIVYSISLLLLVAFTHLLRTWRIAARHA
jgi:acyl phosphate:glycerol-3-phosphate acyltransferase